MSRASETLALQGVRCAGCVLKIERTLTNLPGVELARGNATHKRMRLVWDEGLQSIDSLKQSISDLGYGAHQIGDNQAPTEPSLLPRLAVAAVGMMNIMAFSVSVWFGQISDMGHGTMQFIHWLSAGVALPVVLYSGAVFHRPALRAMRGGHMNMDTPITLAIWITYAGSLFETWRGSEAVYFDAVVSLIFFLLIGRVLEQSMRRRTDSAADNLRELLNVTANRLTPDGMVETLSASELIEGDRVLVQSGERVPADGRLLSAQAEFDESVLTGETNPRRVTKGAAVAAGAILTIGPAELEVTHIGDASQIGQMAQLVEEAAQHKGEMQILSDQFARGYIPLVLIDGAAGFTMWYFIFGASFAESIQIAVAVLIVTCPCAAGLATPAVTSRAINLALQAGIVVKSGRALEQLGNVDQIYLDKTGTASLPKLIPDTDIDLNVLCQARNLAAASSHPLAQALIGDTAPQISGSEEYAGQGIEATSGARLGSAQFVGLLNATPKQTTIWYCDPQGAITAIPFHEEPRPDLGSFLDRSRQLGLRVVLHSGDAPAAVSRFATQTGIHDWFAAQKPKDKLGRIKVAQAKGARVLMIGDGVNDSAALSGASVSASFAGATQIAQAAADLILTRPHLSLLPKAIVLARQTRQLIAQNLAFATIYNVVTVPLALAGFLTPAIAALLMSSSSIIVLLNGLRLRRLS
jgi:Cu2+-exporting ATPase